MSGIDRHDYQYPKKTSPSQYRSRTESWKLIVKAMWDGGWYTIPQIQAVLRSRRGQTKKIMESMVEAGIMESRKELTFERTKGRTKWMDAEDSPDGKHKYIRRDGFLPRNRKFYRLLKERINIQTQKDPSK